MRKVVLTIIVLSVIFAQKSAAQINNVLGIGNTLSKQVTSLVDNANASLRQGDTVKAVSFIQRSEAYLPGLSPKAALVLKNKITTFYVSWVKLKIHLSRGAPDERSEQISSLENRLNVKETEGEQEKSFYSSAVRLATLAKNNPFYVYAKTGYAESLVNAGKSSEAIPVLDSLSKEPSLSNYEKMHILSLLIINSVKLNDKKNLESYFYQLVAINKTTKNQLDQKEYILATSMYLDQTHSYGMAIIGYRTLLSRFGKDGHYDEQLTEAMIRMASLFAIEQKMVHYKTPWPHTERNGDSAIIYFKKADQIIKANKNLKEARHLYKIAFDAYQHSLHKRNKASAKLIAEDTVYRSNLATATKQLEYRYRLALKDQQLKLISQQRQLESLKYKQDRQQSILIILSLLLLVIAAVAFGFVLFQRRRQLKVLHRAEVESLKQSHHIEVINVLAKSQEEERNRIAGRLHDEVGSMLAVARLNLSLLDDSGGLRASISPAQLNAANSILGDVATTIREMSHELMPIAIRQLGFKKSILQLIDDINISNKIIINCVIIGLDDDDKYPREFQTNIYHIIQELFQNIIKHSKATFAEFQLVEHPDTLNIMIEDNGRGIDLTAYKDGRGINLLSTRIDLYHGKITVESSDKNGALIIIDIPLQNIVYSGLKDEPEYSETIPG